MDHERDALESLARLWRRERQTARAATRERRQQMSLAERVAQGLAIKNLRVVDLDAAPGQRVMLWARPDHPGALADTRVGVGDPVLLWSGDARAPDVQQAVVGRLQRDRLGLVVDADYGEFLDQGAFALDLEAPEVTFDRGDRAIARMLGAKAQSDGARLRAVLYGGREPEFGRPEAAAPFDTSLNEVQLEAVAHALAARDVALIHGPPGTGKTRTLAEVVRRAVARGERVLCTAASNTAVDNLAERLAAAGVALVRLGHPARVSRLIEGRTLDALLDKSEARKAQKRLFAQGNELRRKAERRLARGAIDRRQARELFRQARELLRDAHATLEAERTQILARARVVCATAAGADAATLGDDAFDRVVLDEATQAADPVALCAVLRGRALVLAGDPHQLPPTVVDPECAREGLSRTLFERVAQTHAGALRMLEVQYRMHALLMAFPSHSKYGGRLRAAEEVAGHTLDDLAGVAPDPLRPGPLCFVDCAGKGFSEARDAADPSTRNPGMADRVAAEVRRLLSRGLDPALCAVITPYLAQARLLRDALRGEVERGLEIDTVDAFQGREKEAVVVDLVRSNDETQIGFLADTRRMNVALTRARRMLLVVGDSATLGVHPYYRDFIEAAEGAGAYISAWTDEADLL